MTMLGTVPFPYIPSKRPRGAKKRELPLFGFVNVDIPEISASEIEIVAEWTKHVDYVAPNVAVMLRNSGDQACGRWGGDLYLRATDMAVAPLSAALFCKGVSANNESLIQVYGLDHTTFEGRATAQALKGMLKSAGLKLPRNGDHQAQLAKAQDVASGLLSVAGDLWYRIPGLRIRLGAYYDTSLADISLVALRHGCAPDPFDALPTEENHPLHELSFSVADHDRVQSLVPGRMIMSDYDDFRLRDETLVRYDGFSDFAARMMDRLAKTYQKRAGQMDRDELACWMAMRDGVVEFRRSGVAPADAISKLHEFCARHHDLAETAYAVRTMEEFHRGPEGTPPTVALPRFV